MTSIYAKQARLKLYKLGYDAVLLQSTQDSYKKAWDKANNEGFDVYVACHLNSGLNEKNKGHGLTFYDENSRPENGQRLASCVNNSLKASFPDFEWREYPTSQQGYSRVGVCIGVIRGKSYVKPVSILLEPFFLDSSLCNSIFTEENMNRTGDAIAYGIHEWLQS